MQHIHNAQHATAASVATFMGRELDAARLELEVPMEERVEERRRTCIIKRRAGM